jgi:hypothetical protein
MTSQTALRTGRLIIVLLDYSARARIGDSLEQIVLGIKSLRLLSNHSSSASILVVQGVQSSTFVVMSCLMVHGNRALHAQHVEQE